MKVESKHKENMKHLKEISTNVEFQLGSGDFNATGSSNRGRCYVCSEALEGSRNLVVQTYEVDNKGRLIQERYAFHQTCYETAIDRRDLIKKRMNFQRTFPFEE